MNFLITFVLFIIFIFLQIFIGIKKKSIWVGIIIPLLGILIQGSLIYAIIYIGVFYIFKKNIIGSKITNKYSFFIAIILTCYSTYYLSTNGTSDVGDVYSAAKDRVSILIPAIFYLMSFKKK